MNVDKLFEILNSGKHIGSIIGQPIVYRVHNSINTYEKESFIKQVQIDPSIPRTIALLLENGRKLIINLNLERWDNLVSQIQKEMEDKIYKTNKLSLLKKMYKTIIKCKIIAIAAIVFGVMVIINI